MSAASFAKREPFTRTAAGELVERISIANKNGLVLRVITWGATITEVHIPDRTGATTDVALGFDSPESWLGPHPCFGCVAGRYANRIAKGRFRLDGRDWLLAANNAGHHLHGGNCGFDKQNWRVIFAEGATVKLAYSSSDGEEGYPGKLDTTVAYTLTDSNELRIDYEATTDKPTVLNLTNHTYWNLGPAADILGHTLHLPSTKYVPVDCESIPLGKLAACSGAMDFSQPKRIGKDIAEMAVSPGSGYDHTWVIDDFSRGELKFAGELYDPASGRVMQIFTTEPGIHIYTGNYLQNVAGKSATIYGKHAGICLETQHFPDSPNQPSFPSTVLRPGEIFKSSTVHRFSVRAR